jgi:arylsulfatase I/J
VLSDLVDPTDNRAALAGLPPIDSLNMWPLISGATTVSPRVDVVIGSDSSECGFGNGTMVQALLRSDGYKLIIGSLGQNIWQGPYYPNATTKWNDVPFVCGIPPNNGTGCLFNIFSDPTEHVDLAASSPDIVAAMYARIQDYQATAFSPNRGTDDGSACRAAIGTFNGFWGPFTE